ncbi:glycosyltransferase family 1 protein, partial [Acidithiobacillus ferridurans]|nr:glycosyltransferase family 1 protein [Acidithiobacillus ferridurans]
MNLGDRPLLIDVTRLIGRARKKRMPTGVDRVCLAYIAFFHHRAQALMQHGAIAVALSPTASSALFAWL